MKQFLVTPAPYAKGVILLPGDKSIAHRSLIISALSSGKTQIKNFPVNEDCLNTLRALEKLGIKIVVLAKNRTGLTLTVSGKGLYGFKKPQRPIFLGESGTTFRLLLGILSGQNFQTTLNAAPSLSKRPMLRVINPLRKMGAEIRARRLPGRQEEYPPVTIRGGGLKAITYHMPVASAQVKGAILLAALYAKGKTRIIERIATRDHTERMLRAFKADISSGNKKIEITGNRKLTSSKSIFIPADISSAAFFIVLATILPRAQVRLRNVNLNPSRSGVIRVLRRMNADIEIKSPNIKGNQREPAGDIVVRSSKLRGTLVRSGQIPSLIDELPILMVAACFAQGKTVLKGVGELRVKETDRIQSMQENLKKMGGVIRVIRHKKSEDIVIEGRGQLRGSSLKSFHDHRTAMSLVIAGLCAKGKTRIDDVSCIDKSFPGFLGALKEVVP